MEFSNPNNFADGNIYTNMNSGYLVLNNPTPVQLLDLKAWKEFHNWDVNGEEGYARSSFDSNTLLFNYESFGNMKLPHSYGLIYNLKEKITDKKLDPRN